jgi:UDP-N-acetylmuramoyl-tripeptide--D-alanyl-D-alanine ligase
MTSVEDLYNLYVQFPGISIDSRHIVPDSLFFAMKGGNFDGNLFSADALEKGAAYAVIDNPEFQRDQRYVLVDNTLTALQELARVHRRKIKARIIGITGSNGKTTTKELIGRVLSTSYNTRMTKGNLNNHIGVPLTILEINAADDFGVVEMGANHPGEIADLCAISMPDFGIITNIGKAHLEGFGSFEGVIKAKSELYHFIRQIKGTVFLNMDNQLLVDIATGIECFTYGTSDKADCSGEIISGNPFLSVNWSGKHQSGTIQTNLFGEYNLENILAAISIGLYFNVSAEKINDAISSYNPDNNRSQWIDTGKNLLVMDAYNANPSSMKAALVNFGNLDSPSKLVILGDMMELGPESLHEHQDIIDLANSLSFNQLILIGENFFNATKTSGIVTFRTIQEARSWFLLNPVVNSSILIKGSRKMQLEQLAGMF